MGIPTIFIAFIIFVLVFRYNMRKQSTVEEHANKKFWDKENKSHFVRKKEITKSDFVNSYGNELPLLDKSYYIAHNKERLYTLQETCHQLKKEPMMNMVGLLNSDVRMIYGTAQLTTIESYENTYEQYLKTILQWAKGLDEINRTEDAIILLNISTKTGTDISHHYILLGELYAKTYNHGDLRDLIDLVDNSQFAMKTKILHHLNESLATIS